MKYYIGQRLVLIKDWTYRAGVSSGTLPAGAEVAVEQIDKPAKKLLVYFGGRDFEWYDTETVTNHCRSKR